VTAHVNECHATFLSAASLLQVCCSVVHCVMVWCSVVRCGAGKSSVLQCVAVRVAVCCSVVLCGAVWCKQSVTVCCGFLQSSVCSVLQ